VIWKLRLFATFAIHHLAKISTTHSYQTPELESAVKFSTLNRSSSNRSIKNPLTRAKVEGEEGENFYVQFENGLPKVIRKPETKITRDETGYRVTIHGNPDVLQKRKTEILKNTAVQNLKFKIFQKK
jgi:hypothetical protein